MYCTVYTSGSGSVIYINPNCNMKLIYEYLRVVTEVPDTKEIDLCAESGRPLGIYEAPCSASGLQYFKPRSNYFVLTFDYLEGTGELYNPQTLMHYKNHDFEAVFAKVKKVFGIPQNEPIDDNDALLIFEHLLLAYQEKTHHFSDSITSSPSKKTPEKKKRSQSNTSLKARGSKPQIESSVLAHWREEKRVKLAASRMEEYEENMMRRHSSLVRSSLENERIIEEASINVGEEAIPEEPPNEVADLKRDKGFQKRTSQAGRKKGSKKQPKKTGKDGKEDVQLQKAAPSSSSTMLTPKPSFRGLFTESALQLHPSTKLCDTLKTLYGSKSSLFAKSDFVEQTEPTQRRPYGSIRQFFIDHPTDSTELPKPPVTDLNLHVTVNEKKLRKKKKLVGLKNKKIVVTSRSHATKFRKHRK